MNNHFDTFNLHMSLLFHLTIANNSYLPLKMRKNYIAIRSNRQLCKIQISYGSEFAVQRAFAFKTLWIMKTYLYIFCLFELMFSTCFWSSNDMIQSEKMSSYGGFCHIKAYFLGECMDMSCFEAYQKNRQLLNHLYASMILVFRLSILLFIFSGPIAAAKMAVLVIKDIKPL